jgi:tetraacyldisaccharide 4'-kinase
MRPPSFWWREASLAATLLMPFAALYGAVAARRLAAPWRDVGIPVICIGNLDLGGSGKTPTALAVGELLQAAGATPFFLSRGYGGSLAGPVRVEPGRHTAARVGDEPLLLARLAPTVVARDRVLGANFARARGASVVVMDDGFQNPSLTKHLSILVVDGTRGIGNARVFPAGPLRAPLPAQLARAHAILVIGEEGTATTSTGEAAWGRKLPVFHGRLVPNPADIAAISGHRVLAFAGLGNPEKFFATLAAAGIEAPVRRSFPDHHLYTDSDAARLVAEAERAGLTLVTTEKDFVRLDADQVLSPLRERARVVRVGLVVGEPERFRAFVLSAISRLKGNGAAAPTRAPHRPPAGPRSSI